MCRHAAFIGSPRLLATGLLDAPHSLHHQSYRARELLSGSVNADGFGVTWYAPDVAPGAVVYRSTSPIWSDPNLVSLGRHTRTACWVANLRNATDAGTTSLANTHPFVDGDWSFSHNGHIGGFRTNIMRRLRGSLSDKQYAALEGVTESETVFRRIMTLIDEGRAPREALVDTLAEVIGLADRVDTVAQLNVILTDGRTVWATRLSNQDESNSLYVLDGTGAAADAIAGGGAENGGDAAPGSGWDGGAWLASEPFDEDPRWRHVEEQTLVVLRPDGVDLQPIR